jgi:uncharacterized RDD family membrane protein YckC
MVRSNTATDAEEPPEAAPPANAADLSNAALSPARRSLRFAAAVVDSMFCVLMLGPGWFTALVYRDDMRPGDLSFMVFAIGVLVWQSAQAALIVTQGQSIGKRVFGLRIVSRDGARVAFVRGVLLRSWPVQLVSQVPLVGWLVAIGDALSIFRPSYRCLHDELAGTRVVEIARRR